MTKHEYAQFLRKKVHDWGKELSILEDDIERSDEESKEEYKLMFQDVMRNYEVLESSIDEFPEMSDDAFQDEYPVFEDRVSEFETQIKEARETVKDV